MYDLNGKVALITGAGSGIGRSIAERLADEGCDIGIMDINSSGIEKTAELVRQKGVRTAAEIMDVTDFDEVNRAVDSCLGTLGNVDILINCAGLLRVSSLVETSLEDWNVNFDVNVNGVFHCCKAVLPHMMEHGTGRVINMASWYGKIGKLNYSAYCASKFAVIGLTQSLALEMAPHGINVNAICPGTIVDTGMRDYASQAEKERGMPTAEKRALAIPLKRAGVPNDIARLAAFLSSEESAYMTGQAINVTGGLWMH